MIGALIGGILYDKYNKEPPQKPYTIGEVRFAGVCVCDEDNQLKQTELVAAMIYATTQRFMGSYKSGYKQGN